MKTNKFREESKIKKIKIILVEDYESVRKSYKLLLEETLEFTVVGEASNGKELFNILPELSTDVIILDLQMPQMNGKETLKELNKRYTNIKTILLSGYYNASYAREFMEQGARAYLSKGCSVEELVLTIKTVYNEGYYMTEPTGITIVCTEMKKLISKPNLSQLALTEKESAVLKLLCEGSSNKQMAYILKVDINTINYHKRNIYRKTDLKAVGPLVKYAIKNGYTSLE